MKGGRSIVSARLAGWIFWAGLGCLWLYLFPYSRSLNNPNERPRVMQARALVEQGRLSIGQTFLDPTGGLRVRDLDGQVYGGMFVNDLALVCHHPDHQPPNCEGYLYPAKPPGVVLLGVPWLFVAERLGLIPAGSAGELRATWVLRLGGVILPMLLCFLGLFRLLARAGCSPETGRRAVAAAALGTGLFPYGLMFVGHALSGGFLVLSFLGLAIAEEKPTVDKKVFTKSFGWSAMAGAAAAMAVFLEYNTLPVALLIAGYAVVASKRLRWVPGFALAGLAVLAVYAWMHQAMFGSPWSTGHSFLVSEHNRFSQASGFLGIGIPHPGALGDVLVDSYMGWLPLMPWLVLAGLPGLVFLWRGNTEDLPRGMGKVVGLGVGLCVLFVSCLTEWRMMNGWSIGPRYLLPATFLMALAAGIGWQRVAERSQAWGSILAGLAVAGVVIVSAITAVFPSPPDWVHNPFGELAVPLLAEGVGVRNLGLWLGLGRVSLVPFGLGVVALCVWLAWPSRFGALGVWHKLRWGLLAAVLATAWVLALARYQPTEEGPRVEGQAFVRQVGEGSGSGG